MKPVCFLLSTPPPPIHLALLPAQFLQQTARSAFLHARLFLHHSLPLCRTSNDHSTPPRSAQVPTSSFEQPPALPRLAPHGAHDICLSERGRRSWTLCPSVSGSYWPVTPSSTYYSVQGERRREKTSRGKTSEHEREREVRKTFSWISDALLFVPDCPTDTCNRFYPPMFTL